MNQYIFAYANGHLPLLACRMNQLPDMEFQK